MSFDVVAGLDNTTLNNYLAQVYNTLNALDPGLFRFQPSASAPPVGPVANTVSFQLRGAPQANLTPSSAQATAAGASFDVSVPVWVELEGSTDSGTISLTLQVQPGGMTGSGQRCFTLRALNGSVSIPSGNQSLIAAANAAIPSLLEYANEYILVPFQLRAPRYTVTTMGMPVPAVQDGFLLVYVALGYTKLEVPAPGTWPAGTAFVGVDSAVLAATINGVLPLEEATEFFWPDAAAQISGSGTVHVTVPEIGVGGVTVNGDGTLTVQVLCNATAQLTLTSTAIMPPEPAQTFSFEPSATATVTATAKAAVVNGCLQVTSIDLPPPSLDFTFGSIPSWVAGLDNLNGALSGAVGNLLSEMFGNLTIPVYTIPSYSVSLGGSSYDIAFSPSNPSGFQGPQGELLLVEGLVSFTPVKPAEFAPVVGIQTQKGTYVGVVNNGGLGGVDVAIQTNRTAPGLDEQFTVETVDAQTGTFALKTHGGFYVTAVNGGGMGGPNNASCPVHTDASQIGPWEQLTMQLQPNGTYAICTSEGYYLTAVNGGGYGTPHNKQPIHTTATVRGDWETFTAVPYAPST